MSSTSKLVSLFIWLFALLLAIWILSLLPLDEVSEAITKLHFQQWCQWIALNIAAIIFLTCRWQVLITAIRLPLGFFNLLRIRQAGQLVSFVTPGPQFGGEPMQVYWLWHKYSMPLHHSFLAVGVDRFFELWVNFSILLVMLLALIFSNPHDFIEWQYIALVLASIIITMIIIGWTLLRRPQAIEAWINRIISPWLHHKRMREIDQHLINFNRMLQAAFTHRRKYFGIAIGLSFLGWTCMLAELWLLLNFIEIPLSSTNFLLLFVLVRLAFLLPLPGGLGTIEAAIFWGFQYLSFPLSAATSLIVLMRLRDVTILLTSVTLLPGLHSSKNLGTDTH